MKFYNFIIIECALSMLRVTSARAEEHAALLGPTVSDLAYAMASPMQKLDLYLPARGNGPSPVVIWIHGGGMRVGDKRSMPRRDFGPPPFLKGRDGPYQVQVPDVAALRARGYAVVSLDPEPVTIFNGCIKAARLFA